MLDPVDRALPLLDEFGGLDFRSDGELPIRSGLTLRDNVLGFRPVSDDLAFDDEPFVGDLRRHHADAAERVVNVVREKRNLPRDRQPRHVDHDGSRPAKKPHLSA